MKLTLVVGLTILLNFGAIADEGQNHAGEGKSERLSTAQLDEKVASYSALIDKLQKLEPGKVFSFKEGEHLLLTQDFLADLIGHVDLLKEYRRDVQQYCWEAGKHDHIIAISKRMDAVVKDLDDALKQTTTTQVKKKDLKLSLDAKKSIQGTKVEVTTVDFRKISELKQLMGVVEATFNKDGTEKKISDWKPEGMEDSELDRVRREQNLRDRGFKERMSKMARLFGESFGEEDELDAESKKAEEALTKDGSKACVFREAPKKPSASTSTETTPSSATDTGPSKGDDKNPGPGVLDDATGDDGEEEQTGDGQQTPGLGAQFPLGQDLVADPGVNALVDQFLNAADDLRDQNDDEREQVQALLDQLLRDQLDDDNDNDEQQAIDPNALAGQDGQAGKSGSASPSSSAPPSAAVPTAATPSGGEGGPQQDPLGGFPPPQPPQFPGQPGGQEQIGGNNSELNDFLQQQALLNQLKPQTRSAVDDQQRREDQETARIQAAQADLARRRFEAAMLGAQYGMPFGVPGMMAGAALGAWYGGQPNPNQAGGFGAMIQQRFGAVSPAQRMSPQQPVPGLRLGSGQTNGNVVNGAAVGSRAKTPAQVTRAR